MNETNVFATVVAQPVSDALALILSIVLIAREQHQLYKTEEVLPENGIAVN